MITKSSNAQNHYVRMPSRKTRNMDTLRAQMADIARGLRIKEAREAAHLTQPAVVDLMNERAPDELKARDKQGAGKIIRIRGYQVYEAGGGIDWEKAKVLADVLGVDTHWLMTGEERPAATPDLMAVPEQLTDVDQRFSTRVDEVELRLQSIEEKLDRLLHMVDQGLFTPRPADGGSRDQQVGLGAALAQAFQANPEALEALRDQLQSTPVPEAPARTAGARGSRRAG